MGAVARHRGVVASRRGQNGGPQGRAHEYKSFFVGLRLLPDIGAWSPPSGGQNGGPQGHTHKYKSFFVGLRLLPGIGAWSPPGRGRGLRSPLPPTTPNPALGQPPLTDNTETRGVPSASSLPRGSGRSASRCPARARDEPGQSGGGRPAGTLSRAGAGRASVRRRSFRPCGAAISSAPCRAYVSKRNRCSFLTNGASSLNVKQEKRFPLLIPCTVPERRCW